MTGSIYFIACQATNRVKIGFTKGDPDVRLRALQTGAPGQLVLMAVISGSMERERELHEQFADCRLHGEWFDPSDELIEFMMSIVFVAGSIAARDGFWPEEWVLVGLRMMDREVAPLPDTLRAFIAADISA